MRPTGACPICARFFPLASLAEHANGCLELQEAAQAQAQAVALRPAPAPPAPAPPAKRRRAQRARRIDVGPRARIDMTSGYEIASQALPPGMADAVRRARARVAARPLSYVTAVFPPPPGGAAGVVGVVVEEEGGVDDGWGHERAIAASFMERLKRELEAEHYERLRGALLAYHRLELDSWAVVGVMRDALDGYRHLWHEANRFVPPGYSLEAYDAQTRALPSLAPRVCDDAARQRQLQPPPRPPGAFEPPAAADKARARSYVRRVHTRFLDRPAKYKEFLRIVLAANMTGGAGPTAVDTAAVHTALARLFDRDADLLHEFQTFMPLMAAANVHVGAPGVSGGVSATPE